MEKFNLTKKQRRYVKKHAIRLHEEYNDLIDRIANDSEINPLLQERLLELCDIIDKEACMLKEVLGYLLPDKEVLLPNEEKRKEEETGEIQESSDEGGGVSRHTCTKTGQTVHEGCA